jgi:uncharacterized membrane protein YeaQ/YmgE (transglycosylase-associated protein family)
MSIIAWLILGLVAGFIGTKIINKGDEGVISNIVVGVIGAFVGGLLFNMLGTTGVTGLNLWSIFVAGIGSVVLLLVYNAVRRPV